MSISRGGEFEEGESHISALERTVQELQALSIIYNSSNGNSDGDGDGGCPSTSFQILSTHEHEMAQKLIERGGGGDDGRVDSCAVPSSLRVEINLTSSTTIAGTDHDVEENSSSNCFCFIKIHVTLPRGYPTGVCAIVSIVSIDIHNNNKKKHNNNNNRNSSRAQRDQCAAILNEKAKELADSDSEALMELVQLAQEYACDHLSYSVIHDDSSDGISDKKAAESTAASIEFSRRWIWVHHITNSNRCKDIVEEARERNLSGFLKKGYPGIIVIEGDSQSCDEYVQWVKGNKSRPGGFGRNWGHHVRGEELLLLPSSPPKDDTEKETAKLPSRAFLSRFEDIGEDLADLAALSRQAGVEAEFQVYVMQH